MNEKHLLILWRLRVLILMIYFVLEFYNNISIDGNKWAMENGKFFWPCFTLSLSEISASTTYDHDNDVDAN